MRSEYGFVAVLYLLGYNCVCGLMLARQGSVAVFLVFIVVIIVVFILSSVVPGHALRLLMLDNCSSGFRFGGPPAQCGAFVFASSL